MTPDHRDDRTNYPEMDPARSAEIRALLIRTVASTPRPRTARLSRTAFSLAASAALLFAGGIGAGAVVAYDRMTSAVVSQDSATSESADAAAGLNGQASSADGVEAATSESASDSDLAVPVSGELTPVLTINGETGYAYRSDLDGTLTTFLDAAADSDETVPVGQIPIYLADGITVIGSLDPARLLP